MLEFILWFVLIYVLFRIVVKYLLPYLIKYYLKKFQQKFYQQNPHIDPNRKEGDTNVESTPDNKPKKRKTTDNIGEYVDYEEIETK